MLYSFTNDRKKNNSINQRVKFDRETRARRTAFESVESRHFRYGHGVWTIPVLPRGARVVSKFLLELTAALTN